MVMGADQDSAGKESAMKKLGWLVAVCVLLVGVGYGVAQTAHPRPVTHRTKLKQATVIQGYPCDKGYTWFYADGKLDECWVSQETQYGEALIPRGSLIYLKPDGTLSEVKSGSRYAHPQCALQRRRLSRPGRGCRNGLLSQRKAGAVLAGRRPERSRSPMYDRGIHRIIRRRRAARRRGKVLRERKAGVVHAREGLWREAAERALPAGAVSEVVTGCGKTQLWRDKQKARG